MVEASSIRLVTWNCNQAFRRKQHELLNLEPDIAIVPECEHPAEKGDWSAWTDWRWTGDDLHKGLAVFTRNDITISDTTAIDEADHFLHVETDAVDVGRVDYQTGDAVPALPRHSTRRNI